MFRKLQNFGSDNYATFLFTLFTYLLFIYTCVNLLLRYSFKELAYEWFIFGDYVLTRVFQPLLKMNENQRSI